MWIRRNDHEAAHTYPASADGDLKIRVVDWFSDDAPLWSRIRTSAAVRGRNALFADVPRFMGARQATQLSRLFDPMAARRVRHAVRILAGGKVVITDRLHGHILCELLGIPHVLLDTAEGKVGSFHQTFTSTSRLAKTAGSSRGGHGDRSPVASGVPVGMTEPRPVVPLVVPSRSVLRADAVWITIANWAAAVAERYGGSEILSGSDSYTAGDVRSFAFSAGPIRDVSPATRIPRATKHLPSWSKELAKDTRWWFSGRQPHSAAIEQFKAAPFVWQHHDRFHTRGRELADELGVPLVHFVDAPQIWEAERWGISRGPFGRIVERFGEAPQATAADVVACVSDEVAAAVVARLGVDESRVLVTPCTVEVARFAGQSVPDLRADHLEIPPDSVIVGWIGSFRPFHAVELLVEAFAEAARIEKNLHLVLAGDGPTRAQVEARLSGLGLSGQVTFLGQVAYNAVPDVLDLFDISVLPATGGPFHYSPLKLREYAAAGTAIIASDVGDVGETLHSESECVIVPAGSSSALADAMAKLACSPERRERLGASARRAATQRFGMSVVLDLLDARLGSLGLA